MRISPDRRAHATRPVPCDQVRTPYAVPRAGCEAVEARVRKTHSGTGTSLPVLQLRKQAHLEAVS
jgi:hypothetical protein